ncbi:hypothetical protein BCH_03110 [Brucella sp. 191011898]|nr:hypothetical protein BCH_03110 [Brucella sp. 191011898]
MSALHSCQNWEGRPFLSEPLAEFGTADLSGHEVFIAAPLQQMKSKPVLKIGIEYLSSLQAKLFRKVLQCGPHELRRASRRRSSGIAPVRLYPRLA